MSEDEPQSEHEAQSEDEAQAEHEPGYVVVPSSALSAEAIERLIQDFVTRDGTDYGLREHSLEEKVKSVERQLERGDVVIAFDLEQQSATLVLRSELPREPAAD